MSIFKCKMCGGTLEINENQTTAVCEYCGTAQTLSKSREEIVQNLFNRANNLRMKCEFDKAQEVYEKIVRTDAADAEGYWGLVLCKYGIEYVEDPKTFKRIPTCHRTQIESVLADVDYRSAIENADMLQKVIYEAEAKQIDTLQKDILKIANNEEPFDVFICYKETGENGKRTQDSVIANDIYHQLTQEGFKVFYAAITLEDKLGKEYEPYIFSALNSAKVMLVVGSKPEYFNAVWVKNEWGRYLKLLKNDRSKLLIPCYKDMDAYDLPEEFSHLQAQDMSKIGFINDVVRGIKKVIGDSKAKAAVKETVVVSTSTANVAPLLERAFLYLEDANWAAADEYCEKVLDQDPKNAEAYLCKLLSELRCRNKEQLKTKSTFITSKPNYEKAIRFAAPELKKELEGYASIIMAKNYQDFYALGMREIAEKHYDSAARAFEKILDYEDAKEKYEECLQKHTALQNDPIYLNGLEKQNSSHLFDNYDLIHALQKELFYEEDEEDEEDEEEYEEEQESLEESTDSEAETESENAAPVLTLEEKEKKFYDFYWKVSGSIKYLEEAISYFSQIPDWKDSSERISQCQSSIEELNRQKAEAEAQLQEEKRLENERIAEQKRLEEERKEAERQRIIAEKARKKKKKIKITAIVISAIVVLAIIISSSLAAISGVIANKGYNNAVKLMEEGKTVEAYKAFVEVNGYKDSKEKAEELFDEYIKLAGAGDPVLFGSYDEYGNNLVEKTAITWTILEKKDGKILVVSKYAIDCKEYNSAKASVGWEKSSLRTWLNNEFIKEAFSEGERAQISTTTVATNEVETQDKVFLLSAEEASRYFASDGARKCTPTEYAKTQGVYADAYWWLRSTASANGNCAYVNGDGKIENAGNPVNYEYGIRPAMWISIDK